jgi:hypothetical protein
MGNGSKMNSSPALGFLYSFLSAMFKSEQAIKRFSMMKTISETVITGLDDDLLHKL